MEIHRVTANTWIFPITWLFQINHDGTQKLFNLRQYLVYDVNHAIHLA